MKTEKTEIFKDHRAEARKIASQSLVLLKKRKPTTLLKKTGTIVL
jgi:beta-glucosidase-like glycosyl hydrolase